MNTLELKVPPVVVALIAAAAMWAAARYVPALSQALPFAGPIALVLAAAGAVIGAAGVAAFRRAGTTVSPIDVSRSTSMVTTGIFRHTRNPMYVGLLFGLLGWAVHLANLLALALVAAFALYLTRFQIVPEERALSARFGGGFDAYRRSVRRWL